MGCIRHVLKWTLAFSAVLGLVLLSTFLTNSGPVRADAPTPLPTPAGADRYTTVTVEYTLYEWWLTAWSNNEVYCSFFSEQGVLPTDNDVYSACGEDLYNQWKAYSAPCGQEDITSCPGFYLLNVSSKPATREMPVKLPPPQVWVSVEGCAPDASGWCTQQPNLVLTGEEPLPNESITAIQGLVGSDSYTCSGDRCSFRLDATRSQGLRLNFWAYSTYGDSSPVFEALLRVIKEGGEGERLTPRWYVDVLSSQWTGAPVASCAEAWESFPPPDGLPQWLNAPASSADLSSNIPYNYLAANLIIQGMVNATACPGGGLNSDGSANACGLEISAPAVREWQNRFDELIFAVAQDNNVPAQLLKNLFSRESQFWPGVFRNGQDVGLGQLTGDGADTALLWNPSFYSQFCPLVLDKSLCESKGYANLKPKYQDMLRGALVGSVDARCTDCPLGLDLSRADFSVGVFAHTLLANCEQAGKIVQDITAKKPGLVVSYETMWRFTLVNYNAGAGCLYEAVKQAYQPSAEIPLDWAGVSGALDQACSGAVSYVDDISRDVGVTPNPDVTATPTSTAQPTSSVNPIVTPSPTLNVKPTLTATPNTTEEPTAIETPTATVTLTDAETPTPTVTPPTETPTSTITP